MPFFLWNTKKRDFEELHSVKVWTPLTFIVWPNYFQNVSFVFYKTNKSYRFGKTQVSFLGELSIEILFLSCSKLSLHIELRLIYGLPKRSECERYVGQFPYRGRAILIGAQVNGQLLGNSVIVSKEVKWVNEWLYTEKNTGVNVGFNIPIV